MPGHEGEVLMQGVRRDNILPWKLSGPIARNKYNLQSLVRRDGPVETTVETVAPSSVLRYHPTKTMATTSHAGGGGGEAKDELV